MLRSDSEEERIIAANKMYASFMNGGGHPDDWELYKKGSAPKNDDCARQAEADAEMAEMLRKNEADKRKKAEAAAAKERKARNKAEAEAAALREELAKAKAQAKTAPDANERVTMLSGLLSQETVDTLSAEQIAERMQTLFCERERRNTISWHRLTWLSVS
jgi:hypothetical protein